MEESLLREEWGIYRRSLRRGTGADPEAGKAGLVQADRPGSYAGAFRPFRDPNRAGKLQKEDEQAAHHGRSGRHG